MNFDECVSRGVARLDACNPGWRSQIDWSRLHPIANCVLMQLYGDYGKGKRALGIDHGRDYGFNLNPRIGMTDPHEWRRTWRIAAGT